MNTNSRLQFRHYDGVFDSRELAYKYLTDIVDPTKGEAYRLDESRIGEPILVKYRDEDGNIQAIVSIGMEGNEGDGILQPYHIVDTAKLEEEIVALSGASGEIMELLQEEIERAKAAEQAIKDELDTTQVGAGLNEDGTYTPNDESTYLKEVASLKGADNKLDEELARVEQARKDVTGQYTDAYVPNESLTTRPIAYIADATSLNDADVKLDEGLQKLDSEVLKNVVVDGVSGVVEDNIAVVGISGNSIPIGEYENYSGKAIKPHPIHDDYSVLDAVKQLDLNFLDFTEKEDEKIEGLHLVKITDGLDANVREAYDLVNKDGMVQSGSSRILIYKDSSRYKVYIGHTDDRLNDYTDPESIVYGTGDTALCFIYLKADSTYQLVAIDIEDFLQESEFLDGLRVDNHKVYVKIDGTSEGFLTVSANGIKIAGVQNAIDSAVADEETRAQGIESFIQSELDRTQRGAGLNEDGTYHIHNTQAEGMTYIANAESIDNATVLLDRGLKAEDDRVTSIERSFTANLNALSATVETFSASTVQNIETLDEYIEDETDRAITAEEAINATVNTFSAGTVAEIARLDEKIDTETGRATTAEEVITNNLNTLSNTVETFSAGTVAEITRNKIASEDGTILIDETTDGTDVSVNIDGKTVLKNNSGVIGTGLKVAELTTSEVEELGPNVREAYRLVDNNGTPIDNTIVKIYKSSSLVSVELVNVGGTDYIRITYIDNEGRTETMDLDIQQLIFQAEFRDGLVVNGAGEVRVKIDETSESFLTVSSNGVKIAGVQDAIDAAVAVEQTRAENAEDELADMISELSGSTEAFISSAVSEFNKLESDWTTPGSIKHTIDDLLVKSVAVGSAEDADKSLMRYYVDGPEHKYYASSDADDMYYNGTKLSTTIETINTTIAALSGGSESVISGLTEKIYEVSGALVTLIEEFDAKVYEKVKAILKEVTRETKLTADDNAETINIGFADDALFGPISNG